LKGKREKRKEGREEEKGMRNKESQLTERNVQLRKQEYGVERGRAYPKIT
jgi:hypothetical protein